MISTQRSPIRYKPVIMAPTLIPAIAPEAKLVDGLEASGLLDGLDTGKDEDVVSNALDQQLDMRLWKIGIPFAATVDEVENMLLEDVVLRLRVLEDIDEDSTALASATETFAFALANLVMQTLI